MFERKINQTPLVYVLFGILVFYLPFHCKYTHLLKGLSETLFRPSLPYYLDKVLSFGVTDLVMIALLVFCVSKWKSGCRSHFSLLVFLIGCLSSLVFCEGGFPGWAFARWLQMALPALLCVGLSHEIERRKALKVFCWALLAASLIQCLVALTQYVIQGPIGLRHLGEVPYSAYFSMPSKSRWIFDRLFHVSAPIGTLWRVMGTLPHPNTLGGFMGVALLASSWLFLDMRKGRHWLGAALSLQIFVLFLTFSRAALFGWIAAFFAFLWMARRFYRISLLALVVGSSTLLSGLILYEQLLNRGGVINYNELARKSDEPRLVYQKMAIEMVKKNLLLGVGWNHYPIFTEKFVPKDAPEEFRMQTVHSIYFLLLAETGVLGLGAFLFFVFSLIWKNIKQGIARETAPLLAIWFFLLMIGFCDHYLLTGQEGRLLLFISAALLSSRCSFEENSIEPTRA